MSEEEEAFADYQAEMAQQDDYERALRELDVDAPGFIPVGRITWSERSADERAREDGFPNAGGW